MKIEDGRITPLRAVLVLRGFQDLDEGFDPTVLHGIAKAFNILVIDAPEGSAFETLSELEMAEAGWVREPRRSGSDRRGGEEFVADYDGPEMRSGLEQRCFIPGGRAALLEAVGQPPDPSQP
jgi:hypothetical protein